MGSLPPQVYELTEGCSEMVVILHIFLTALKFKMLWVLNMWAR